MTDAAEAADAIGDLGRDLVAASPRGRERPGDDLDETGGAGARGAPGASRGHGGAADRRGRPPGAPPSLGCWAGWSWPGSPSGTARAGAAAPQPGSRTTAEPRAGARARRRGRGQRCRGSCRRDGGAPRRAGDVLALGGPVRQREGRGACRRPRGGLRPSPALGAGPVRAHPSRLPRGRVGPAGLRRRARRRRPAGPASLGPALLAGPAVGPGCGARDRGSSCGGRPCLPALGAPHRADRQ